MNWNDWYKDYEQFPSLQARLKLVGAHIASALNELPSGPIRILSICSGDGRDILSVLPDHPRRDDVTAILLDNHEASLARGRAAAATAGLQERLQFVAADATLLKNYAEVVPADLVLLSGFLGHLPHTAVPRLIEGLPMLCKHGGQVIWNRHLLIHHGREQVPAIRGFFKKACFEEIHYETTDAGGFAIGRVRFNGQVLPLDTSRVLFEFVGLDRLLPIPPVKPDELPGTATALAGDHRRDETAGETESSIPGCFETICAANPARPAIGAGTWQPTYGELNAAANRFAQVLIPRGATGDRVALVLPHDAQLIAAILAVLKAGKIVIVLNPSDPPARLQQIVQEAEARLVVTDRTNRELASQIATENQEVLCFEENASGPADNPGVRVAPDAVAFIIFTSGSTGRPKGVMQTHRNIIHNVFRLSRGMQLCDEDRISLLASPSGGQGLSTMWCALLNGGALCPFPIMEKSAAPLADWLAEHRITIFILTASLFRHFVKSLPAGARVPTVRLVRIASEPATTDDFAAFQRHFADDCVLLNSLSSSETGNITQHRLTQFDKPSPGRLPVGRPAAGMEVLLVDENEREVQPGEIGEIIVRSRYLSPGYWRNESLTAERFRNDNGDGHAGVFRSGDLGRRLPDGTLLFMDRKDTRIKLHGYRIELSEIEDSLRQQAEVDSAIVSVHTPPAGESQLVAHVVPKTGRSCTAEGLRRGLRQSLPGYMIPAHFIFMSQFPLTPHGKINREALPPPADKKNIRRSERPRDLIELQLTRIWKSALGAAEIGRRDDFFDLGGTSLQSVEVLLAVEEQFGVVLSPSVLAEHSTIERMAELVAGQVRPPSPTPLVVLRGAESGRPLFFIHSGQGDVTTYIPLVRQLAARPIYGLQSAGLQGECWPLASVRAMARRYLPEILARDPDGPYSLVATCMGGLVAFELAQLLVQQGKKVGFLGLMDTHFPLPLTRHEPGWRKIYTGLRTPMHENWRALRWRVIRALGWGQKPRWLPGYRAFVAHQNGHASRRYRPIFYPGELTLFTTIETKFLTKEDPRLMMRGMAQVTNIIKIPGNRRGLFMKPGVDELARQLQSALDKSETTETAVLQNL